MLQMNNIIQPSVGADYAASKLNVDDKRSHISVQAGFIIGINL
jgi:hypothetical protein